MKIDPRATTPWQPLVRTYLQLHATNFSSLAENQFRVRTVVHILTGSEMVNLACSMFVSRLQLSLFSLCLIGLGASVKSWQVQGYNLCCCQIW
jgi:hypothetical protein